MNRLSTILVLLLSGACAREDASEGAVSMGRLEEVRFAVDGGSRSAALYVPDGYDGSRRDFPLIVFLHGLGERGSDNAAQTRVGLYPAIRANPERFPCLVLMPQCPGDACWVRLDAAWAANLRSASHHVEAALDAVLATHRVDRERIALTGLSMGGFGTLIHGAATIDRWRALVAVCGGGREVDAPSLARKPLWLLHGDADPLVPAALSQRMHAAVDAAGGDVRLTLYPGVGHDSWTRAYADPQVIAFLLGE